MEPNAQRIGVSQPGAVLAKKLDLRAGVFRRQLGGDLGPVRPALVAGRGVGGPVEGVAGQGMLAAEDEGGGDQGENWQKDTFFLRLGWLGSRGSVRGSSHRG